MAIRQLVARLHIVVQARNNAATPAVIIQFNEKF